MRILCLYPGGSMKIERLQVELTNKCNAKCPMCTRTLSTELNNKEISFVDFKMFFPKEFLKDLKFILFCGNFGEPTLCKDILKIHEYMFESNPQIQVKINTNGGTRSVDFWTQLGQIYSDNKETESCVSFSIDGLEDTNHLYRVNVDWNKLMDNAQAFISTGALAEWTFIPFKHNQHQFPEIKKIYKKLGFVRTNIQQSRRFDQWKVDVCTYPLKDKEFRLEPPDSEYFLRKKKQKKISSLQEKCLLYHKKEIYVDTWGNVHPCCWYGTAAKNTTSNKCSLYFSSIANIIQKNFVESNALQLTWTNPNSLCGTRCWVLE